MSVVGERARALRSYLSTRLGTPLVPGGALDQLIDTIGAVMEEQEREIYTQMKWLDTTLDRVEQVDPVTKTVYDADRPPTPEDDTDPGLGPDAGSYPRLAGPMEKGKRCYICALQAQAYFERGPQDHFPVCGPCVTNVLGYHIEPDRSLTRVEGDGY